MSELKASCNSGWKRYLDKHKRKTSGFLVLRLLMVRLSTSTVSISIITTPQVELCMYLSRFGNEYIGVARYCHSSNMAHSSRHCSLSASSTTTSFSMMGADSNPGGNARMVWLPYPKEIASVMPWLRLVISDVGGLSFNHQKIFILLESLRKNILSKKMPEL